VKKSKKSASKRPAKGWNILVANGVNLDLLGKREPHIYGTFTLQDLEKFMRTAAAELTAQLAVDDIRLEFFQSNDEAIFLEKLSDGHWHGVLLNPGAWTHTSVALRDRLAALGTAYVEVHISNLAAREEFRKTSFSAAHAKGVVYGFGHDSYRVGLYGLLSHLQTAGRL